MNEALRTGISILRYAIDNHVSAKEASLKNGKGKNYISNIVERTKTNLKNGTISREEFNAFDRVYNEYINVEGRKYGHSKPIEIYEHEVETLSKKEIDDINYDADADDAYDERSVGEIIRGKEAFTDRNGVALKKITGYKYRILIKGEPALTGSFSRSEMDAVYRLYSQMDGAGLALRAVAREFNNLSFRDFKRILRAFNITKSSLAVAPHIMEEFSEEEIVAYIRRNKENSILKKLDNDRHKYYEKRYLETQKEIVEIKTQTDWIEEVMDKYFEKNRQKITSVQSKLKVASKNNNKKALKNTTAPLMVIFGDVHYGKKYDNPVFGRGYNKDIAHERIMEIAKNAVEESKNRNSSEVVLICLGDILETASEGMHPGHYLEMDLYQDEQVFFALDSFMEMITYVLQNTNPNVKVTFSSIHGNHDRIGMMRDSDKNRTGGKMVTGFLERIMKNDRLEFNVPKNNLLKLVKGNLCIFAQHGDSPLSKKKPAELLNLFGENRKYFVSLQGHWHRTKIEEGTNFVSITTPSVASTDKFILEELGNNNLPGYLIGHETEAGGFDYKKITLY
jgi:hypothetical protein